MQLLPRDAKLKVVSVISHDDVPVLQERYVQHLLRRMDRAGKDLGRMWINQLPRVDLLTKNYTSCSHIRKLDSTSSCTTIARHCVASLGATVFHLPVD